jgi:hypothetical protein
LLQLSVPFDLDIAAIYRQITMKMITRSAIGILAIGGISTLALLGLSAGDRAQAATINSLYNTGVDAAKAVLSDGTIGDPHYSLVSVPTGSTREIRTRREAGGAPYDASPYVGDTTLSTWIGPNNDNQLNAPSGTYNFQTTFDLTGYQASTAQITGRWAADDNGVQILLNGVDTGVTPIGAGNFGQWSTFSINNSALFVSGANTLNFIVVNTPGRTALRTELVGTADLVATVAAVPEPSDVLGSAIAFGAVVLIKRKLTKKG